MGKKNDLGLALDGGESKGFIHYRAIPDLINRGIVPDIIAGPLAVIFIADRYDPEEVLQVLIKKKKEFVDFTIPYNSVMECYLR